MMAAGVGELVTRRATNLKRLPLTDQTYRAVHVSLMTVGGPRCLMALSARSSSPRRLCCDSLATAPNHSTTPTHIRTDACLSWRCDPPVSILEGGMLMQRRISTEVAASEGMDESEYVSAAT